MAHSRAPAFTLLEMLVALALVSVVTLSLYSSLRTGFNARDSARTTIEPLQAAAAAIALLRYDIESALPPTGLLAGEFVGENETGAGGLDSDILSFHTCSGVTDVLYPDEAESVIASLSLFSADAQQSIGGDVQFVEFVLEEDEEESDRFSLVRYVSKNLLAPSTPEPTAQVICRDVLAFNVRYLDGSEWVDSWDSTQQEDALPPAIEVTLKLRRPQPEELTMARPSTDTTGLTMVTVFTLPCVGAPAEEENRFIR